MNEFANALKMLTQLEIQAITGGNDQLKGYVLPEVDVPEEKVSHSKERTMPLSNPIEGNMKPYGNEVLEEYIKVKKRENNSTKT